MHTDLASFAIERNEHWMQETWARIVKIIQLVTYNVLERPEEEHWRVKTELLKLSLAVLENCSR